MSQRPLIYGMLAEFSDAQALVDAAHKAHEAGYRRMDAYSPFPVEGLSHALGFRKTWLPTLVLIGGVVGAASAYFMQWYASVISYPLNVGGRPLNSWPAFIPVTFEVGVLTAALTAVFGMLALNGLPRPHHPLFGIERFDSASRDGFFLCIESRDPKYVTTEIRQFLESLAPKEIWEVPND